MPSEIQLTGAQSSKPIRFTPIFTERWVSGLWTQRSPLRDAASTRQEARYYGTRNDGFIDGQNVEVSNRLTIIRRPGLSQYNSQIFETVNAFYEFRLFNTNIEQIKVMTDTTHFLYDGTGPNTQTLVWTKSVGAGQTYMQYVANILYFGNGVDQKKWIQNPQGWQASHIYTVDGLGTFFIDSNGNLEQLTSTHIAVTSIKIASNILTVSFNQDVSTILTAGLDMSFAVTIATFLNTTTQELTITSVSGATVTADFVHTNYGTLGDSGYVTILEGGTPLSGTSQPVWNITVGGTTQDNTALWTNRGSPTENFGIAGPSQQQLGVVVNTNTISWKPNTYYSQLPGIIDANGNFQTITVAGTSGSTSPVWNTTPGGVTEDNTITWTLTRTAAQMVWQPNTTYSNGTIIIATPTGGAPSVFELDDFTAVRTSGAVNAYLWTVPSTGTVGVFQKPFPLSVGSANASATGNSLLFDDNSTIGANPIQWATMDASGTVTGHTVPFPSFPNNYNLVILVNLVIPTAGNYTVNINHKDGMLFGIGNGAIPISGPHNDPQGYTQTAVNGYPIFGGTNTPPSGSAWVESFIVNFPTPGTYTMEVNYAYWYHSGQTLTINLNGVNPAPGTAPTSRVSGPTAPTWPNFSTAFAPGYANATEVSGQLVWSNIGFVTDFTWNAKIKYDAANTSIVDNNSYNEIPFEAGTTAITAPTFVKTVNGLTTDNPNLTWINTGKASIVPAGNLSTFNGGWSYAIALVNTLTNTVSNAGPVTVATGSFLGASGVTITGGLPDASAIDPQADYVAVFRTKDGGASYYLIPGTENQNTPYTLPLSQYLTSGYVDSTPDSGLNTLISPALNQENSPPPTGIINLTYHLSRVFGSVGNTVVWSSGPDSPIGNGIEGFSPSNVATFPSLVKRIVPTSIGALIFTVSDIYLIAGKGTAASPLFPTPYVSGTGLLSYNALAVNGTIIYLFTTDNQLMALDPSAGQSQVGFPIGDQLEDWDPSQVYVTWHVSGTRDQAVYISNGSTGWYRLITAPSPETGLVWAPFAAISGGCRAVQSVEVSPGLNRLLVGPTNSGPILRRDTTTWSDNGVNYDAFVTIGSIVLAQPGQVAELDFITTDSLAIGSTPQISVLIDEIFGTFDPMPLYVADPPQLLPSTSLYAQRFYFSQTQDPAICRHLQIKVSWPAENFQNEMLSLTIYGGFLAEL